MEYNKNFRLQLRHGKEDKYFPDRDAAIKYIEGVLSFSSYGKEELLLPYEPVLFFYGEDEDKKAIVMVGLPDGTKYDGKPYFLIDTAYLEDKIDAEDSRHTAIEEKLEQEIADRKAAVEAEAKAREDADNAEETARIEMGNELKEVIDYNKDDIKGVIAACGIIYNDKMSSDRVSYSPDSHDEVIRDAKSVAEAVDKVSKFAAKVASELNISVENTDTVDLTMIENTKNGGSVIKADVNIAGSDGLSKKTFDNNIIGKTTGGLYVAASIEPSATNPNMLVFKTSGYVDGQFKVDAYETEVPLAQYSGDSGKKTGINVEVDEDKNIVSAQLNLSSNENNILKLEDGEYFVEGRAKNIKYNDTTVAQALTNQKKRIDEIEEDVEFVKNVEVKGFETETSNVTVSKNAKGDFTISNDVKLSTDKSIIIANGGLSANVKASYSSGTSTLLIEVGNNSYKIDLSELAVSVLKSASYDSTTEEIVLSFIVGDKEKTIRIPVGTLIHDVVVDDTDTIDLTLTSVSGGPNRISAELKVDKTHSDNILTVTSNGVYVSKAYITDAVKEESDARKSADDELRTTINSVSDVANKAKEDLAEEINRATKAEEKNATAIAQEIKDARAAEKNNSDAIAANAAAIEANETAIADETSRAKKAEQANTDSITAEVSRAKEAETKNANDITFEVNRATEKEADLLEKIGLNTTAVADNAKAIADEVKRATDVENGIASDLSNEILRAKAAEGTNTDAITAEATRATTAEGVLESKVNANTTNIVTVTEIAKQNKADIANEITRAKSAEEANDAAIDAEKERAIVAEKTNATAISDEAARAKEIESGLRIDVDANKKAISDEVTRATQNEEVLLGKINDEATRAKGEEKNLSEKVTTNVANITTVTAQSNSNKTAIEKEIERATAAENKLISDLSNETSRAENIEDGLKASITANTTSIDKLNDSVATLTNSLNVEVERATKAENANAKAVETETNRATEKEADLLEKIEKNASDITKISTSVGEIELKKEGELSYALYVNGTKHGEFSIPQDQFLRNVTYDATEKKLIFVFNTASGDVTSEISIADLVDTYINGEGLSLNGNVFSVDFTNVASVESVSNAVENEKNRAKAAEESIVHNVENNKTAISDEISRATKAEEKNAIAIAQEINDARTAEQANTKLINDEIARAKAAETTNSEAIKLEVNTARAAENGLSNSITSETNRAKAAEENNAKAVEDETVRAKEVESELKTSVETNTKSIGTMNAALSTLSVNLENEVTRAKAAEALNASNISVVSEKVDTTKAELSTEINKKANSADVYTKNEITEKLGDYAKTADVTTLLSAKANSADVANVYATKEALQEVKDAYATVESVKTLEVSLGNHIDTNATAIDNFGLTYNAATSTLTYTNKNGVSSEYKLYSGTLVEEGYFDEKTNSIVLVVKNGETESKITIPVTELLSDVDARITANSNSIADVKVDMSKLAKDWDVVNSSTIELVKSTVGEKDSLTASVKVASSNKQAIQSTDNGIYVSNDLEDYTVVYGSTGTISAQDAVSKLLETTANNATKISTLSDEVKTYSDRISTLETDSSAIKERVTNAEQNIVDVKTRMNEVETKMETTVKTVETYSNRISTLEGSVKKVEENIGEVDIKGMYDAIEAIKTDLIGDKTNPKEGTIWYVINNLIDGGRY